MLERRTGTLSDWRKIIEAVRARHVGAARALERARFLRAEVCGEWLLIVLEWDPADEVYGEAAHTVLRWAAAACHEVFQVPLEVECYPPPGPSINVRFCGAA